MRRRVELSSPFHRLRVLVVMLATMILTIGFAASVALAVPAAPMVRTLSNPDGTTIQARQWGDEWYHGWETLEGYTIVKDELGFWCYAEPDVERGLVPSPVRANGAPSRTLPQHVRPPREFLERIDEMRQAAVGELKVDRQPAGPPVGYFPVLLISFSDREPTYTQGNFANLLFGDAPDPTVVSGPGTMKNFYEDVSFGQYSVQGVVGGWYTAPKSHDYYGENLDVWGGIDAHAAELVAEAVRAADDAGFDWTPYDSDGDGYVDVVAVVHQGTGEEEGADKYDIWSHSWNLTSASYFLGEPAPIQTHDGKIVDRYIIMPELLGVSGRDDFAGMATVGVFCHEYGHAIGLPDLYDTDYSSQGIGNWGLMGGGSWNGVSRPGDSPAYLTAWSRVRKGWLVPELVSSSGQVTMPGIQESRTAFQLLDGPEYFLLENRQPDGFDAALPGHGLLIWHIDDTVGSNSNDAHRMVDLEEADGLDHLDKTSKDGGNRGDPGDPYPGSTNNQAFTAKSYPSNLLYDGSGSGAAVTNIAESQDGVVTATIDLTSPPVVTAVSATPAWGAPPLVVTFSGEASDPDGDLASTWWEMPDGSTVNGAEATATFAEPGVYTAVFHAEDSVGNPVSRPVSVVAAEAGTVLFIDDDEGQNYEGYFTGALDVAGIPYVTTTAPVYVSPDVPYVIIWNCNDGYPTLTADDQAFLAAYLDGGGRLFLSGQDILWEIGDDSTFDDQYLHVASREDDVGTEHVHGVDGDPISGGLSITLDYPFDDWSDSIYPDSDAVGIFRNDHGQFAALRYEGNYKVVFFAFPFEAVPSGDATELIARIAGWMRGLSVAITSPRDNEVLSGTRAISWRAVGGDSDNGSGVSVTVSYSRDGGSTWNTIATGQPASGSLAWDTTKLERGGEYVIRAVATDSQGGMAEDRVAVRVGSLSGMLGLGPNPASTAVNVYHAAVGGTIFVYDVAGRLVADHVAPADESVWVWNLTTNDGRPLANGLYLIVFVAEDGTRSQVERLIIQRR